MDETGFSTVPSKVGKVIAVKDMKKVGQMTSQERGTMVTMALAANAAGNTIPPFFLFPRKNMQTTFLENASIGSVGFANESGWMKQDEFIKFIAHFIKHSNATKNSPKLLLLDNHSSHLSIGALDMAAENGVTLLSFPPHCSHRMQPLDVSVYGPVKAYYKSQCNAWMRNNVGKVLEIRHIPSLVETTLDLALVPRTIKSGFEATGICPFNPDIFVDSDFVQAEVSGENVSDASLELQQDEDEQRRIVVASDVPEPAAHETVSTSSEPSTSISRASSLCSLLSEIGPLQKGSPKKKSNRGRKAMRSTVLTSADHIAALKDKQTASKKRNQPTKSATKPKPAKRGKKKSSSSSPTESSDEEEFCTICLNKMPKKNKSAKFHSLQCVWKSISFEMC